MEDGLYKNLPFEQYLALERVSSTMIKWSRVSPYDCWARSWMGDVKNDDTFATSLGRLYHTMLLEGREVFWSEYCREFSGHDYLPKTVDDIKKALSEKGLKPTGTKPVLEERAREAGIQTYAAAKEAYLAKHAGKIEAKDDHLDWVAKAGAVVSGHPTCKMLFANGDPEVTILWTDHETGIKMKARIDYLQKGCAVDLKTFSNPLRKPVRRAVTTAFAGQGYHIQAACYMDAINVACQQGWISDEIDREFVFLFVQSGPVPVIVPRILGGDSSVMGTGKIVYREGLEVIKRHMDTFGAEPWLPIDEDIEYFDDLEFPAWITEY
jgi:hypothetical protein